MDRLDFSKSIDIDPVTQVEQFFNEVMAMYDLVGGCNYVSIHGLINGNSTVSFVVLFSSQEEAKHIYDTVVNKHILVYNTVYELTGSIFNNELKINITQFQ